MATNRRTFKRRSNYYSRPKVCQFCTDKNIEIDYKNTDLLRRYITDEGKIRPRRQTGTCGRHQRFLPFNIMGGRLGVWGSRKSTARSVG